MVAQAIELLPHEYRQAVTLRDVQGLSYDEIARLSNCPLGTVKSRVNRGRAILQVDLRGLAAEVLGRTVPLGEIF